MVKLQKTLKFAKVFDESINVDSLISGLWDGSPPNFSGQDQEQYGRVNAPELSEQSKRIIQGLQPPEFQQQIQQLLLRGLQAGLKPELTEGYRSQERQDELYSQGRTTPGQIVTQTRNSMHTKGMAVDIAELDEDGNTTYNASPGFWDKMGEIGRELGLNWGGDWKQFQDKPHFQYRQNRAG